MTRDELEAMDKTSLIAKGKDMGIQLTPAEKKGDMVDKILGLKVEAPAADEAMPMEGALRSMDGKLIIDYRMMKLTIMETETDKGDVFLGLNGHGMLVKRGVEVVVPEPYIDACLRGSIINTKTKDAETGREQAMQIMRIPFTAVPA